MRLTLDGWVLCATLLCLPFRTATAFQGCSRLWQTNPSIATAWLLRRTFFAFWQKRVLIKITLSHQNKKPVLLDWSLFGGRGWIRTTEAESSRFTVCPLWPLGNSPKSDDNHYNTGKTLCQEKNHGIFNIFVPPKERFANFPLDGRWQTCYTVSVLNMLLWLSR